MTSLRSKIALSLFLGVAAFVGADLLLQQWMFSERFARLDEELTASAVDEVAAQVEAEVSRLATQARDWSKEAGEGPPPSFSGADAHLFLVHDSAGRVLSCTLIDPVTGSPLKLREIPQERLSLAHAFLRAYADGQPLRGLMVTERGAILIAAHEVESEGSPTQLVVGRFFDGALLERLQTNSGLSLEVVLAQGHALSPRHERLVDEATMPPYRALESGEHDVSAWTLLSDLGERPALLLGGTAPRRFGGIWNELQRHARLSTLAVAVLFPLLILFLLQWIVTGPLQRLTTHAKLIGGSNDTDVRLDLRRRDEIGQLADEFDRMLEKLAHSREQVVQNARLAGMSEVSSGVLHNVGNLLNSVTVSADLTRRKLHKLPLGDLQALLSAVQTHKDDLATYLTNHPRGVHLPRFLEHLLQELTTAAEFAQSETVSLGESVERVVSMIKTLEESDARVGVNEATDLAAHIDTVLELCSSGANARCDVTIVREYAQLPKLDLERHRLLEVLTNIVRNALQATESATVSRPTLTVRTAREDDDVLRIEIVDNGVGIPPEDLARVFHAHYTTRPGAQGLGLHMAATVAEEMGGAVTATSEGPGLGTTVTVRLPFQAANAPVR